MKKTALAALGLIAWLLVGGCGEQQPRLPALDEDGVILAFGDSLTRGTGARLDQSYPAALARLSARKVVNAGVPGELSSAGLARLERVLESVSPQLLILCHGGNDMLRKKNLTRARRNLEAMIAAARARDIEVLLLGVPKPGLWLATASFYTELAQATNTALEPDAIAAILGDPRLKSDAVHPNANGYQRLAEDVYATLQKLGAL